MSFFDFEEEIQTELARALESTYFESEQVSLRGYNVLPGSFITFGFTSSDQSLDLVRENLKTGGNLKKRVARKLLPCLRLLPYKPLKLVYKPEENFPGEVIRSGRRTKIFDLKNNRVYTIVSSYEEAEKIAELKNTIIGEGINTPEIIYYDDKIMVEKYVSVRKFELFSQAPQKGMIEAYRQLFLFYRSQQIEEIELNDKDFSDDYLKIKKKAHAELTKSSYKRVCKHGDFHLGNIGFESNNVVLFDWQSTKKGFLLDDLVYFLRQQYRYTGDKTYFEELNTGNYSPELKAVLDLYQKEFGLTKEEIREYYILSLISNIENKPKEIDLELLRHTI